MRHIRLFHPTISIWARYYNLGTNFNEFDLSAIQDDAKIGMKHLSAWEKIALVSDHEMIKHFCEILWINGSLYTIHI